MRRPQPSGPNHASQAESLVAAALARQGWAVLARNLRGTGYELDIVATKGDTLAVIEVKARCTPLGTGRSVEQLLPPAKRQALRRGAMAFLASQARVFATIRFDLALVTPPLRDESAITYIVAAF